MGFDSLWLPFTQMQEWLSEEPVIIVEGEGAILRDDRGRSYIDGVSSIWCNLHGHRHPRLDASIRRQLDQIAHSTLLGVVHQPALDLAERLITIAPPGLTKVFYSDDGSTAVEVAIKMAYQFWQLRSEDRPLFIGFRKGYHGDTLGAVSLGGIELFHQRFKGLLKPALLAPSPYCYRCELGLEYPGCGLACLEAFEKLLAENAQKLCAVALEPLVQCAGGIIVYPPGFTRGVYEACQRHGVLLIADEVAVGFGRTGRMFASEHEQIKPDFLCLAKGLTGGYLPLAVTLTTTGVFDTFLGEYSELKHFFHGHTYTGNPLGCAAALASLKIFDEEEVLETLPPKIEFLREKLGGFPGLDLVGDVRQCGLIAGIELVRDKNARKPFDPSLRVAHRVCLSARKQGVLIRPLGDVIVIFPPLCITIEQLEQLLDTIYHCIRTLKI